MMNSDTGCVIGEFGHCVFCGRPGSLPATDGYRCPGSVSPLPQDTGLVTVYRACLVCGATGLSRGIAGPKGIASICPDCGGSGAKKLTYAPFTGRMSVEGVSEVVAQSRKSMTYEEFLENIPAGPLPHKD